MWKGRFNGLESQSHESIRSGPETFSRFWFLRYSFNVWKKMYTFLWLSNYTSEPFTEHLFAMMYHFFLKDLSYRLYLQETSFLPFVPGLLFRPHSCLIAALSPKSSFITLQMVQFSSSIKLCPTILEIIGFIDRNIKEIYHSLPVRFSFWSIEAKVGFCLRHISKGCHCTNTMNRGLAPYRAVVNNCQFGLYKFPCLRS